MMSPSINYIFAITVFVLVICIGFFMGRRRANRPDASSNTPVTPVTPAKRRNGCGCLIIPLLIAALAIWLIWPVISPFFDEALASASSLMQGTPSDSIVGDPDLSASFIDNVLNTALSPATGIGGEMYQDGAQYHIKTSFALAIFHEESKYGLLGAARTTQSIGNLRNNDKSLRSYPSWKASVKDFYQTIKERYVNQGLTTLDKIIPLYTSDSNGDHADKYSQSVHADMAEWAKESHS
jgi:hypothetical protein